MKGEMMIWLILFWLLPLSGAYNITDEELERYRLTTKVDLNDPSEIYSRSMRVYFKDPHHSAEITRRLSPIFERRHRKSLTLVNNVSDEELAAHMSPIIIGYLDQELLTKEQEIASQRKRYYCWLATSLTGTAVSLTGVITTLVIYFHSCS